MFIDKMLEESFAKIDEDREILKSKQPLPIGEPKFEQSKPEFGDGLKNAPTLSDLEFQTDLGMRPRESEGVKEIYHGGAQFFKGLASGLVDTASAISGNESAKRLSDRLRGESEIDRYSKAPSSFGGKLAYRSTEGAITIGSFLIPTAAGLRVIKGLSSAAKWTPEIIHKAITVNHILSTSAAIGLPAYGRSYYDAVEQGSSNPHLSAAMYTAVDVGTMLATGPVNKMGKAIADKFTVDIAKNSTTKGMAELLAKYKIADSGLGAAKAGGWSVLEGAAGMVASQAGYWAIDKTMNDPDKNRDSFQNHMAYAAESLYSIAIPSFIMGAVSFNLRPKNIIDNAKNLPDYGPEMEALAHQPRDGKLDPVQLEAEQTSYRAKLSDLVQKLTPQLGEVGAKWTANVMDKITINIAGMSRGKDKRTANEILGSYSMAMVDALVSKEDVKVIHDKTVKVVMDKFGEGESNNAKELYASTFFGLMAEKDPKIRSIHTALGVQIYAQTERTAANIELEGIQKRNAIFSEDGSLTRNAISGKKLRLKTGVTYEAYKAIELLDKDQFAALHSSGMVRGVEIIEPSSKELGGGTTVKVDLSINNKGELRVDLHDPIAAKIEADSALSPLTYDGKLSWADREVLAKNDSAEAEKLFQTRRKNSLENKSVKLLAGEELYKRISSGKKATSGKVGEGQSSVGGRVEFGAGYRDNAIVDAPEVSKMKADLDSVKPKVETETRQKVEPDPISDAEITDIDGNMEDIAQRMFSGVDSWTQPELEILRVNSQEIGRRVEKLHLDAGDAEYRAKFQEALDLIIDNGAFPEKAGVGEDAPNVDQAFYKANRELLMAEIDKMDLVEERATRAIDREFSALAEEQARYSQKDDVSRIKDDMARIKEESKQASDLKKEKVKKFRASIKSQESALLAKASVEKRITPTTNNPFGMSKAARKIAEDIVVAKDTVFSEESAISKLPPESRMEHLRNASMEELSVIRDGVKDDTSPLADYIDTLLLVKGKKEEALRKSSEAKDKKKLVDAKVSEAALEHTIKIEALDAEKRSSDAAAQKVKKDLPKDTPQEVVASAEELARAAELARIDELHKQQQVEFQKAMDAANEAQASKRGDKPIIERTNQDGQMEEMSVDSIISLDKDGNVTAYSESGKYTPTMLDATEGWTPRVTAEQVRTSEKTSRVALELRVIKDKNAEIAAIQVDLSSTSDRAKARQLKKELSAAVAAKEKAIKAIESETSKAAPENVLITTKEERASAKEAIKSLEQNRVVAKQMTENASKDYSTLLKEARKFGEGNVPADLAAKIKIAASEKSRLERESIAAKDKMILARNEVAKGRKVPSEPKNELLENGDVVFGSYSEQGRIGFIYKNGDAVTVVHEYLHHIITNEYMPREMTLALQNFYYDSLAPNKIGQERLIEDFVRYLAIHEVPKGATQSVKDSLDYMKAAAFEMYKKEAEKMPEDMRTVFWHLLHGASETQMADMAMMASDASLAEMADGLGVAMHPTQNMMGSLGAKMINSKKLAEAMEMRTNNTDPFAIWEKTGFWRDVIDGVWKFNIPEYGSKLLDVGVALTKRSVVDGESVNLIDVLDWKQFYGNYGIARDAVIDFVKTDKWAGLYTSKEIGGVPHIGISVDSFNNAKDKTVFLRSILSHELQHLVQIDGERLSGMSSGSGEGSYNRAYEELARSEERVAIYNKNMEQEVANKQDGRQKKYNIDHFVGKMNQELAYQERMRSILAEVKQDALDSTSGKSMDRKLDAAFWKHVSGEREAESAAKTTEMYLTLGEDPNYYPPHLMGLVRTADIDSQVAVSVHGYPMQGDVGKWQYEIGNTTLAELRSNVSGIMRGVEDIKARIDYLDKSQLGPVGAMSTDLTLYEYKTLSERITTLRNEAAERLVVDIALSGITKYGKVIDESLKARVSENFDALNRILKDDPSVGSKFGLTRNMLRLSARLKIGEWYKNNAVPKSGDAMAQPFFSSAKKTDQEARESTYMKGKRRNLLMDMSRFGFKGKSATLELDRIATEVYGHDGDKPRAKLTRTQLEQIGLDYFPTPKSQGAMDQHRKIMAQAVYGESWETVKLNDAKVVEIDNLIRSIQRTPRDPVISTGRSPEDVKIITEEAGQFAADINSRAGDPINIAKNIGGERRAAAQLNMWERVRQRHMEMVDGVQNWYNNEFTDWMTEISELAMADSKSPLYKIVDYIKHGSQKEGQMKYIFDQKFKEIVAKEGNTSSNLDTFINIGDRQLQRNDVLWLYLQTRGNPNSVLAQKIMKSNLEFSASGKIGKDPKARDLANKEIFDRTVLESTRYMNSEEGADLMRTVKVFDQLLKFVGEQLKNTADARGIKNWNLILENYFPMARKNGVFSDMDVIAKAMGVTPSIVNARRSGKKTVSGEHMMSRSLEEGDGQFDTDVMPMMDKYLSQAALFIGKLPSLDRVVGVISDPRVQEALKNRYGTYDHTKILYSLIENERFHNGRSQTPDSSDHLVNGIKNRIYQSALGGLAIGTWIRQTAALVTAASEIRTPLAIAYTTGKFFRNMGSIVKDIFHPRVTSEEFRTGRGAPRRDRLDGIAVWRFMKEGGAATTRSTFEYGSVNWESAKEMRGLWSVKYKGQPIGRLLVSPLKIIDSAVREAVWETAYQTKKSELSKTLSRESAERGAWDFAEMVSAMDQPGSITSEKFLWYGGSAVKTSLTMFAGAQMRQLSNFRSRIWKPMYYAYHNGVEGKTGMNAVWHTIANGVDGSTPIAQKAFYNYVLPSLMFGVIARGRLQSDPDEILGDMFAYNISWSVPILGPAIAAVVFANARGGGNIQPAYAQWLETVVLDPVTGIKKWVVGDESFNSKSVADIGVGLATAFGTPRNLLKTAEEASFKMLSDTGMSKEDLLKINRVYVWGQKKKSVYEDEEQ